MADNDDQCRQCLIAIAKIETQLDLQNKNFMKIFFALLALAGAQIGSKYIGTPLHVEVTMTAYMFGAIFVLAITAAKWRCLNFWEVWIRLSFVCLAVWATSLRIYHYQTDTPFTQFEGIITQLISLSMAMGFIILAWKRDIYLRKRKRRWDDEHDTQVVQKED